MTRTMTRTSTNCLTVNIDELIRGIDPDNLDEEDMSVGKEVGAQETPHYDDNPAEEQANVEGIAQGEKQKGRPRKKGVAIVVAKSDGKRKPGPKRRGKLGPGPKSGSVRTKQSKWEADLLTVVSGSDESAQGGSQEKGEAEETGLGAVDGEAEIRREMARKRRRGTARSIDEILA